ncbi:uncharacterized protein LOC122393113 [Amphibalanus amphitrite]|uniref:uncharacterized protein LOC122393113 n=1 Tax=Amphibalanus amphitrite TaxID=1232801 RepID=UPI001C8FF5AF|nr:uncharacterized protein LOC122393113 [Amphibalanus amphitrite]
MDGGGGRRSEVVDSISRRLERPRVIAASGLRHATEHGRIGFRLGGAAVRTGVPDCIRVLDLAESRDADSASRQWRIQRAAGRSFQAAPPSRVVLTPRGISTVRSDVWPSLYRSVRDMFDHSPSSVQQSVLRSRYSGGRRFRSGRLVQSQQLCQSAVQADSTSVGHDRSSSGSGHADRTVLAGTAVDGQAAAAERRPATAPAASVAGMCSGPPGVRGDRATPKSGLETVRLADLWRTQLSTRGWSHTASELLVLCLADSTQQTYNRYLQDCFEFCVHRAAQFPPADTAILAEFLLHRCKSSDRPHSTLRCISAALGAAYDACGMANLMCDQYISRLCQAIVKCGTAVPMLRSRVMDVSAFTRMFRSWPCNNTLSTKQLRLKTITLLALVLMLRPSDVAPKASSFDFCTSVASRFVMSVDHVKFDSDGSASVTFFGVKNDAQRTGFEVTIPPCSDAQVDPVEALRVYISRTESIRCPRTRPLFVSLVRPHGAISASAVAGVLQDAIQAAEEYGLPPGHTPKDFRPTGATAAVGHGFNADDVQRLGRWKTRSVFMDRYVHNKVPDSFTDSMLQ